MRQIQNGPSDAPITLILAHGAGAGMDTPFMTRMAEGLADQGIQIIRFEFDYMARRREDGKRRPPERADKLIAQFEAIIEGTQGPIAIGGKSMGGRMASMIAASEENERVKACVCLGYPFHPSGKPEKTRTDHLKNIKTPTLICQGERDLLGTKSDVAGYNLAPSIEMLWLDDGDHDLKPRKVSGFTHEGHMEKTVKAVAEFLKAL